jgi:hypothetical protein
LTGKTIPQWVIYFDPDEAPGELCARKWFFGDNKLIATEENFLVTLVEGDVSYWTHEMLFQYKLEAAREEIQRRCPGLICIPRQDDDEPQIVELWT